MSSGVQIACHLKINRVTVLSEPISEQLMISFGENLLRQLDKLIIGLIDSELIHSCRLTVFKVFADLCFMCIILDWYFAHIDIEPERFSLYFVAKLF